jgi:hypothetical protein
MKVRLTILPPIPLLNLDTDEPVLDSRGAPMILHHLKFISGRLADSKLHDTADNSLRASDIRGEFREKQVGDEVELSEADFRFAKPAFESPTGGYVGQVAIQIAPYIRQWLDAKPESK